MIVIVYAAGISSRLSSIAKNGLKGLIKINGKRIIEYQLEWIAKLPIKKIVIVLGLEHKEYIDFLGDSFMGKEISYVINPDYKHKGNMLSLWHARKYCNDDVIFTTSDLLCNRKDIDEFIQSDYRNKILIDRDSVNLFIDSDPVKVHIENKRIIKIRKKTNEIDRVDGISVGIYKFSKTAIMKMISSIDKKIIDDNDDLSLYYAIDDILDDEIVKPVYTVNSEWFDIDTPEDLKKATLSVEKIF